VQWSHKAASLGHAGAQFALADRKGEAVPQYPVVAAPPYRISGEEGLLLGLAYAAGDGLAQDGKAAAEWFLRAAISYSGTRRTPA
jgi:TPR repeat protein